MRAGARARTVSAGEPEAPGARLSDSKRQTPSGCLGGRTERETPGADGRRPPRRLVRLATALFPLLGAALAMCLFGSAGVAHAQTSQVLVSNLGQTMATAGGTEHGVAQGFRTGANTAGYTLTSIDLQLDVATSAIPPTVTLHRGSAAGSTVADFTAPSTAPGGGFAAYTFTPTTTPMLEPNTDYWVVARGASRDLERDRSSCTTYAGRFVPRTKRS